MKVIKPEYLISMRNIQWDKIKNTMHLSIYSSFILDENVNDWLDKESLMSIIEKVSKKELLDNSMTRKHSEVFIFSENKDISSFNLKFLDIEKNDKKENFLPLKFDDDYYKSTKGTFDNNWLLNKWPAFPEDATDEAYQMAAKDQQGDLPWEWDSKFSFKSNLDDEFRYFEFPSQRIQAFISKEDSFKELEISPDVLWLIPDDNIALLISHGYIDVNNHDADEINHIYIADNSIYEDISLDQHKYNFEDLLKPQKIKKISVSTKPDFNVEMPKFKMPEAAEKAIADVQSKMDEINIKYADIIAKNKKPIPEALQKAMDDKNPTSSMAIISQYVEQHLTSTKLAMQAKLPTMDTSCLDTLPSTSIKDSLNAMSISMSESISNMKKLSSNNISVPEDITAEVKNHVTALLDEQEESSKIKALKNYRDGNYKNKSFKNFDFTDCDLTNADFSECNFNGAIFNRTKIDGTCFDKSIITEAEFCDLRIISSTFNNASLEGTKFENIIIDKSNFSNTSLNKTHFNNVKFNNSSITKSNIKNIILNSVIFNGEFISYLEFEKAEFNSVTFTNMDIDNIRLIDSTIQNLNLISVNTKKFDIINSNIDKFTITNGEFIDSSLSDIKIAAFKINYSKFENIDLSNSNIAEMRVNNANIAGTNFENAITNKSKFISTKFIKNIFNKTNLNNSMFYKCDIQHHNFHKVHAKLVNFNGSILCGSVFEYTNLLDSNFAFVNLANSSFIESNLYDINLYQANIDNVVFHNNLTVDNFNTIKIAQTLKSIEV